MKRWYHHIDHELVALVVALVFVFLCLPGCRSPADREAWKEASRIWEERIRPVYFRCIESTEPDIGRRDTILRHAQTFGDLLEEGATDD